MSTPKWAWVLSFTVYCPLLFWLYYPGLSIFFASDDWVILNHTRDIPVSEPWLYFSPKTVWFYRPLQTLQYALTYHFFGFNQVPYNLQLLAMHLVAVVVAWHFLRLLLGAGIATIAALLFSVLAIAPETLLWKGNFNTLQNTVVTLIACYLFTKYLHTRKRSWYYTTIAASVANWFTKESSINLCLILGTVWLTFCLQSRWTSDIMEAENDHNPMISIKQAVGDLWIFSILAVAYIVLRQLLFENIEQRYMITYNFVPPLTAVKQLVRATNRSLLFFLNDPLILSNQSILKTGTLKVIHNVYPISLLIVIFGWWRKKAAIIFAVLFAASAQFPTFALQVFYESRYYYLSGLGGCIFLASALGAPLFALPAKKPNPKSSARDLRGNRAFGFVCGVLLILALLGNIVLYQQRIAGIKAQSLLIENSFRYLRNHRKEVPPASLILFSNTTQDMFYNGFGIFEMTQLGTDRTDVGGVAKSDYVIQSLKDSTTWKNIWELDVAAPSPILLPVAIPSK